MKSKLTVEDAQERLQKHAPGHFKVAFHEIDDGYQVTIQNKKNDKITRTQFAKEGMIDLNHLKHEVEHAIEVLS